MKETQLNFESLSSETGLKLFLDWFTNIKEIHSFFSENQLNPNIGFLLLVHMAIKKECDIKTIVGLLKQDSLSYQETSDFILKCIELNMLDYCMETKKIYCKLFPPQEIYDKYNNLSYPLPLLVKPKKIMFNNQSGYLSYNNHIILGNKINKHSDDVCLDHINKMNSIKLSLNLNVVSNCKNIWKTKKKETLITKIKKDLSLKYFMKNTEDVYKALTMQQDFFYLCHRYDKRGRVYCTGYHVNYMGNEYQKAVVEFNRKELIK